MANAIAAPCPLRATSDPARNLQRVCGRTELYSDTSSEMTDIQPNAAPWPPRSAADFPRLASLPAYVFAQVNAEKAERIAAGEDVIDLGMGNPDLGTPAHIVD